MTKSKKTQPEATKRVAWYNLLSGGWWFVLGAAFFYTGGYLGNLYLGFLPGIIATGMVLFGMLAVIISIAKLLALPFKNSTKKPRVDEP